MRALHILLFLLLLAPAAAASPPATTLRVKVFDQNSNVVPHAVARLTAGGKASKEAKAGDDLEVFFPQLAPGVYVMEVEAQGFKKQSREVRLAPGRNELTVTLEVGELDEEVKVVLSAQERATEQAFGNFLTREQIAALPDDPEQLEAELKRVAGGSNVVIRVDGFSGGRLPAKSQIASIRITRSSYDAEHHEVGATFVDIVTKVGDSRWSGSLTFSFNDESLNARNAAAGARLPEQTRNTLLFLDGPIVRNKTSVSFLLSDSRGLTAQNIVAALPSGVVGGAADSNFSATYFDTNVTHNLTKNLPVKLHYIFSEGDYENLGVGGFNLPERAFSTRSRAHELRFSESGYVGRRFLNEVRIQYKNESSRTVPRSESPAVIVLDSFSAGGAGNSGHDSGWSLRGTDNFLFGVGQHAVKVGGDVVYERREQTSAFNHNGTFIFSSLSDFQLGRPSLFSRSLGVRSAGLSQWQVAAFVQDDVRLGKTFILSAGVRYERQNNLNDANNFSPRVSFAWSPLKAGKTTFRGGVGVFYNWLDAAGLSNILSQDAGQPGEIIAPSPAFPNPLPGVGGQFLPQSYWRRAEDLDNPYGIYSSFGVQQQLSRATQLRIEYTYRKGIHQFRSRDVNAPILGVRPDPNFGRIVQVESSAAFVRNAVNVGLTGSFIRDTFFTVDYTLSKAVSDADGIFNLPSDSYDLRADRSAANDDQRHRLYASFGWKVKKGLRFTTIFTSASALPYTIITGRDDNGDTNFNDRPPGVGRNSVRGAWRRQVDAELSYTFSFLDRKGGDASRSYSVVTTSGEAAGSFDFDPEKRFSVRLFVAASNVFNNANLTNFVGVETSPFFRQATAALPARAVKFGTNFRF
jgi:hypothetical protein